MIQLTPTASNAADALHNAGGVPYVVGGAIRNTLLKQPIKDIDLLVTGIDAMDIPTILPGAYQTGEHFGVFRWRSNDGGEVEIALPRTEISTGPGHKDFEVHIKSDIPVEADLMRRDFTVNAMAWDIYSDFLIDLKGGQDDIRAKRVQTVFPEAFRDDPLRILRGLVLVARFGFWLSGNTIESMIKNSFRINDLPAERIQEELDKIFEGRYVDLAITDMREAYVLGKIFPELNKHWDYNQNNPHHQQILGLHQLSTLRHVADISNDADLRLAGLLHDIGKPASAWVDPDTGSNHFYRKRLDDGTYIGHDHEIIGAQMAMARLLKLKYPTKRIARIGALIEAHMWNPFTTEKGARKFLNTYGDHAMDLLTLRYGDQNGKYDSPTNKDHNLITQRGLISMVEESGDATSLADLAINGNDLIEAGFKPGPIMGKILNYLTERVVDEPSLNTKEMLIAIAEDTYSDVG